jgi:hypothetical protein
METTKVKEYYNLIDKILWEDWDPIGINTNANIRNEYYGYVPLIFQKTLEVDDEVELAKLLFSIEINRIGLDGNFKKCLVVAKKILAFKFDYS